MHFLRCAKERFPVEHFIAFIMYLQDHTKKLSYKWCMGYNYLEISLKTLHFIKKIEICVLYWSELPKYYCRVRHA